MSNISICIHTHIGKNPSAKIYDDLHSKAYLLLPDRDRVLKQFTGDYTTQLS
jgi:hypothetical protein